MAVPTARPAPIDPALHDGCPQEMTRVDEVCIDRWEDSLVDPYGKLHDPSERPLHDIDYQARSLPGVRPQAYISRLEARAACENAGKRLCTLGEWYAACEGPQHTTYPYGASFDRKRCNVDKPHLLSRLAGTNPLRWRYAQDFNNPELDREPGFLAKTGAYSGCTNDYGAFDMVGNLHEWVSDSVDRSLPLKIPLRAGIRARLAADTGHGIFMGGFFSTGSQHGQGCRFITIGHGPTYHDYSTGFRCCRSAAGGTR